jgi:thiol-disulfide isomerase/thioredoxin
MKQTAPLILIILALAGGMAAAVLYLRGGGVSPGENAPGFDENTQEFTLTDTDGNTFSLSDFKGKVVLLDFMATWCVPCVTEISSLKEVQQNFGDSVVIISIDVETSETSDELKTFKEEQGATWRFAVDTVALATEYNIVYIPHLVIVDKNGVTQFTHTGTTSSSVLISEIEGLL